MIGTPCGLGLISPELCQTYVQQQAEQTGTISLIQAKPTIVNKPDTVTEDSLSTGMGDWLCAFNRWVSENPVLSGAGLAAAYFLMRGKR